MYCEACGAPLYYDPSNGEWFCNEDPSHGEDE